MEKDENTPEVEQEEQNNESEEESYEEQEEETGDDSGESEEGSEEDSEDDVDWKKRALQAEKLIEKNKKKAKQAPKPSQPSQSDNLSSRDMFALIKADVHEEDFDEVQKAAKLLDKSVAEALKDDTVQSILNTRAEYRKTAQATNTKAARPSQKKVSAEELKKQASEGKIPDDKNEAEELFWARRGKNN